jgi:hypothetical protein
MRYCARSADQLILQGLGRHPAAVRPVAAIDAGRTDARVQKTDRIGLLTNATRNAVLVLVPGDPTDLSVGAIRKTNIFGPGVAFSGVVATQPVAVAAGHTRAGARIANLSGRARTFGCPCRTKTDLRANLNATGSAAFLRRNRAGTRAARRIGHRDVRLRRGGIREQSGVSDCASVGKTAVRLERGVGAAAGWPIGASIPGRGVCVGEGVASRGRTAGDDDGDRHRPEKHATRTGLDEDFEDTRLYHERRPPCRAMRSIDVQARSDAGS